MNYGAFVVQMIAEGVKKWRARIRLRRATRKGNGMAVNTGLRSSSNMVIAGAATNILVELLQVFYPEFVLSAEMRTYLTLAITWVASRFTKTPSDAGVV